MTDHSEATIDEGDLRIEAGYARLQRYWDPIGPSDADVLTYLVNPQFQGKPAWPNMRQAYRIVRPEGSLIIASDGLSDPFVGSSMTDAQGYGCEVFIEVPEFVKADLSTLRGSWAFKLIENFAMNVADWGGISEPLAKQGVLSVEFPMAGALPDKWLTADASAGFLVNLPVAARTRLPTCRSARSTSYH